MSFSVLPHILSNLTGLIMSPVGEPVWTTTPNTHTEYQYLLAAVETQLLWADSVFRAYRWGGEWNRKSWATLTDCDPGPGPGVLCLSDFCAVSQGPAECMCRAHNVNVHNLIMLQIFVLGDFFMCPWCERCGLFSIPFLLSLIFLTPHDYYCFVS